MTKDRVYGLIVKPLVFVAAALPFVWMAGGAFGSWDAGLTADPVREIIHRCGKTALNMLTTQWAKAYPNFRINAVDPGYTATDFNHHSGPQTVQEGTDAIVEYAQLGPDGPTGGYFDRHGELPW